MKRKTRKQTKNDMQFAVNEEYARLLTELIDLIKRGVYPKRERIRKIDVEMVGANIGISALRKLNYEEFKKQLAKNSKLIA